MSKGEKISLPNKVKLGKKKIKLKIREKKLYFGALKKLIKILLAFLDRFKVVCEFSYVQRPKTLRPSFLFFFLLYTFYLFHFFFG